MKKQMLKTFQKSGKAGEYLTCADLLMQGYNVHLATEGAPFDLLVEIDGEFFRVQSKATNLRVHPRSIGKEKKWGCAKSYVFSLRPRNGKRYVDIDFFALVALDKKEVAYIPFVENGPSNINLRSKDVIYRPGRHGTNIEDLTFEKALKAYKTKTKK